MQHEMYGDALKRMNSIKFLYGTVLATITATS